MMSIGNHLPTTFYCSIASKELLKGKGLDFGLLVTNGVNAIKTILDPLATEVEEFPPTRASIMYLVTPGNSMDCENAFFF